MLFIKEVSVNRGVVYCLKGQISVPLELCNNCRDRQNFLMGKDKSTLLLLFAVRIAVVCGQLTGAVFCPGTAVSWTIHKAACQWKMM